MKIKDVFATSVVVLLGGVFLASVLPYARTHFTLPIRVLVISATFLICFGSLVLLRKLRKGEQVGREELGRFALQTGGVLIAVAIYEQARSSTARLWIAVVVLTIAVVVVGIGTFPRSGLRLVWALLTVIAAIILYLVAR
jgi:hypothetical protein